MGLPITAWFSRSYVRGKAPGRGKWLLLFATGLYGRNQPDIECRGRIDLDGRMAVRLLAVNVRAVSR